MKDWGPLRYFPLVWAALRRKPVRSVLTFLSVTVAFALFGLMIGLNATINLLAQQARADRVWTFLRYDNTGLPIAVAKRVATLPGVKTITVMSYLNGYVGDPKNRTFITMGDGDYGRVYPDQGVTPEQWDAVHKQRNAIVMSRKQAALWHRKTGDMFTVIAPEITRADGGKNWVFKVVGISEDISYAPAGMIFGNYDYYDKSRPLADQGKINEVDFLVKDAGQAAAIGQRIDRLFANSASPTFSDTETSAFSPSNFGGMDVQTVTREVAAAGLLMMLFLTATVITQSVRERRAEFATLKTIGFSDAAMIALVMVEAALPCLSGAVCGVAAAAWLAQHMQALMPPDFGIPAPTMAASVFAWALASACGVALAGAALPVLRLRRMDIASALSGRA
ncbi:MAG TPA: ABC transporter permease [Rhizomicrobium sp.]|nr:ABC transporter permease [Rhizomicrobium sp.]